MAADIRSAYLAMLRAGRADVRPSGLEYLLHLVFRSSFQGKGFRDVPASELCRLFRTQVEADFGAFAGDALARFGIRNGDDMGRAVFLLAEYGCLSLREGETRADYAAGGEFRFGEE